MTNRPVQGGPAIPVSIVGVAPGSGGASGGTPGTPGTPAGAIPEYTAPGTSTTTTGIISPASGALVLAPGARREFSIQNCGTNPLFVYLGTGANTTTLVNYILKGCTVANDGTGGFISDEFHKGAVSVAGTTPSLIASQHL